MVPGTTTEGAGMTSRRIASMVGAAVAACALALAGATPAAAAAPSCPAGYVCSWAGTGFTGSRNLTPIPVQGCTLLGFGDISTRRSALNPGPRPVVFAQTVRRVDGRLVCGGPSRPVGPGEAVSNLGFAASGVVGF